MGVEVDAFKNLTGGWSMAAKRCDSCKTAAAAVFCRPDAAFLCLICDTKIHGANKQMLRHERVWMCEVCEQAPAAVTCKADAAALCVSCDADIHSANPLARRHERVPVEPFYEVAESIVKAQSALNGLIRFENGGSGLDDHEVDDCVVSWLLPSNQDVNSKLGMDSCDMKSGGDLFFPEMDPFLEFEYQNPMDGKFNHHHHQQQQQQQNYSAGSDSVVPVQTAKEAAAAATAAPIPVFGNQNCFDIDFSRSKLSSFSYPTQSLSQSVSSSSLEVGVVPDGSSMSDISYPFGRTMTSSTDPSVPISASSAANQAANQIGGMDREARVLRYREKRKNRKFEKTIRYASRKAYAETRPRIKGRFAKRTETESEMERSYNSSSITFMADNQFGVVPSF